MKKTDKKILTMLFKALEYSEGYYSGIPECCVESFVSGNTGLVFKSKLSKKDQAFYNTSYWNYIPCMECFKKRRRVKIKNNGVSGRGQILRGLIRQLDKTKFKY